MANEQDMLSELGQYSTSPSNIDNLTFLQKLSGLKDILNNGSGMNTSTFGANIPTVGLGLQGLSTIGGLYTGLGQLGLANRSFNFQKDFANKNYENQKQTYNTNLEGLANARAVQQNQSQQSATDYYNSHKLTR